MNTFHREGGLAAVATGITGFLYSVAFVFLARTAPETATVAYSVLLLVGGLLSSLALVALWERQREAAPAFALWALALGLFAALGSAAHGGFDLANAVNPPARLPTDVPNQVDPRGLLTFGFAGISVAAFSLLMLSFGDWPRFLVYVGFLSALLLILIYVLRLTLPSSTLVLVPAALEGFIVNPLWYVWLGIQLRRGR
jgi:hypothetical protein